MLGRVRLGPSVCAPHRIYEAGVERPLHRSARPKRVLGRFNRSRSLGSISTGHTAVGVQMAANSPDGQLAQRLSECESGAKPGDLPPTTAGLTAAQSPVGCPAARLLLRIPL